MKIRIQFVLFVMLVFATISWGQTEVRIANKDYANIPLRLYAYENLLTHRPLLLEAQTVDKLGNLTFSVNLKQSQLLYIPLYSFKLIFYAEPNKKITLQLPKLEKLETAFARLKTYTQREIPLFVKEKESLNQQISEYDREYNHFIKANFKTIYNKKNPQKHLENCEVLEKSNSVYYKEYVKYKKAYIGYLAGLRMELLPKYFAKQPILLQNTAYTSLLKKITKEVAIDFPHAPKYKACYKHFAQAKTYKELSKSIQKLNTTTNANFNEHFFLYVLHSGIAENILSKKVALAKIQLIANNTLCKENKALAQSIIKQCTEYFKGKKAPHFTAKDTNGQEKTEHIFVAKKPTLLAFFDASKNNSENILALQNLQKKHANRFQVVVFSATKKIEELPKNWTQFVIPFYSYILQDYKLGRFPYYVLVEKNGKISKKTWQQYLISLEKEN